jgi:predicted deacylase
MAPGDANQHRVRRIGFRARALAGWAWTVHELAGAASGPRLCVIAGVHVNELASIEATFRLIERFRARRLRGSVALMPVVNLPALAAREQHVCPIDGCNINFSFPGDPDGTFSPALADALLNEWAGDADCLVDLHGGDLCETVARFTVAATVGDAAFDSKNLALAQAFDPQIIVRLPAETGAEPGRSCSGRARQRRHAAFAEAGANGVVDEASVAFHVDGVLRVAGLLGMIDDAPAPSDRAPTIVDRYHWVRAEVEGWCRYLVEPADAVQRGQPLAVVTDLGGALCREVTAPADGVVLWRCTHAAVVPSSDLFGIGA